MKQEIKDLIKKVEQKDPIAMETLALYYLYGENGLKINPTEAYKLFKESAGLGNLNSLYNIAKIHLVDKYGIKDTLKGLSLLKKAAKSNHTESLFELGKMYYYGKEVKKNIEEAESYIRAAANADDASAKSQYLLGYIWENGFLEDYVDLVEAFKYYEKSAKKDYVEALFKCGVFCLEGIEDFLEKDIDRGIKYLRKSSIKGHAESSSLLAKVYIDESKRLLDSSTTKSDDSRAVLSMLNKIDTNMLN